MAGHAGGRTDLVRRDGHLAHPLRYETALPQHDMRLVLDDLSDPFDRLTGTRTTYVEPARRAMRPTESHPSKNMRLPDSSLLTT